MRKKAGNFAKSMRKRQVCLWLALLLFLFSFAGCGQMEDGAASSPDSPFAEPGGAPFRAVYPISEIRLSFPGGSGTIRYRYQPEHRSVQRETILSETDVIPGIAPQSSHTLESYLFNSDGRLESYLLEEVRSIAAKPDGTDGGETENGADKTDGSQSAGGTVEMTVRYPLFRRQFFYVDGRLNAVTEEDLQGQAKDLSSENDSGTAAADPGENAQGVKKRFLRDARGFITGAILSPMTGGSPSNSPSASSGASDLPSDTSPEQSSGGAHSSGSPSLFQESYVIGEGGLPMYLYGAAEGETMSCTYTLSGRSVVGRQLCYAYHGTTLWTAKYNYSYDDGGRIVRIDWTITYPHEEINSGSSGLSSSEASSPAGDLPQGLLLPAEGSCSMTLSYAENQPTYLAAACEELRLGSLEQGYSADRNLRLLAPGIKSSVTADDEADTKTGEKG